MVQSNLKLVSMEDNGEKMVEEDQASWTVECLRGRLLAERLASKVAKQDAELLGNRLIELEEKLKLEIKLKNKAEKKLRFLIAKLESIALSPVGDYLGETSCSLDVNLETGSSSSVTSSLVGVGGGGDELCEINKDNCLKNNVAFVPTRVCEPRINNHSIPSSIGTLRLRSSIGKGNVITLRPFAFYAGV